MPDSLVLVEGESDRTALLTLARRLGRSLDADDVVAMGGITNLRRHLTDHLADHPADHPADHEGLPSVVLVHDVGETAYVERTLAHLGRDLPRFVCDADLEDELIRALGVPGVLEVVAAAGDLHSWETLCNQPFHRDRSEAAVLRRFFGTTSGRKEKYAALLTAALDPDRAPAPLAGALAAAGR